MCRRFNCCIFNHPCPIFCPCSLACTGNEVVNPIIPSDYAFFNSVGGDIASQAIIPVSLVQGNSQAITPSTQISGAVVLSAGTYEISYLAGGIVPSNGTMSIKLRLNGTDVAGSVLTGSQAAGNVINLTQNMVLTVPQGSTLELVNNSAETTTFYYSSMFIRRI